MKQKPPKIKFVLVARIENSPERGKATLDTVPKSETYSKKGSVGLKKTFICCKQLDYRGGAIVANNPSLESVKRAHLYEKSSDENAGRYLGYFLYPQPIVERIRCGKKY